MRDDTTSVDKVVNVIANIFADPDDFDISTVPRPNSVDDPSVEDPAMVMSDYSEIESVRLSFGGPEIYDVFVARVK